MLALGNWVPENVPFFPQHSLAQLHGAAVAPTLTSAIDLHLSKPKKLAFELRKPSKNTH